MICRDIDIDRAMFSRHRQRSLIEGRGPSVQDFIINNYASAGPGDPYWANVSSLMHMDGPNLSTSFPDEKGKSWTANGGVQVSTAQSVFGGESAVFNGSNAYLSAADSVDWQFGTGSFTVECRWRPSSASVDSSLMAYGTIAMSPNTSVGWALGHFGAALAGKVRFFFYSGGTQVFVDSTTSLAANTWYALRAERDGSTVSIYVNGTREATTTSAAAINTGSFGLRIGYYGTTAARYANGYIDELRITKGVGRSASAASYVVDTSPFPNY